MAKNICLICGKEFFGEHAKRQKYCSVKCYHEGRRLCYRPTKTTKQKTSISLKENYLKHPELKVILSQKMKGRNYEYLRGRHPSLETRQKMSRKQKGILNGNWKGGWHITAGGYIYINTPDHPNANKQGYVLEHRLIMEKHLGRTLLSTEIVHHINGDVKDNRIENLMLYNSQSKHLKEHFQRRKNEK